MYQAQGQQNPLQQVSPWCCFKVKHFLWTAVTHAAACDHMWPEADAAGHKIHRQQEIHPLRRRAWPLPKGRWVFWVSASALALCWGFWRRGYSLLGTRQLCAVSSAAAALLCPCQKSTAFLLWWVLWKTLQFRQTPTALQGVTDRSYREAFGSPSLDAALNLLPSDACLVPWHSLSSLRVFTSPGLRVPPCPSIPGCPPERLQPFWVGESRGGRLVCEFFR